MPDRRTRNAVVFTLLMVLSVVAGGATALSGTAAAQGGGINVIELSTNSPVTEGGTLDVTAQLECDASEPCSQEVALRVGGEVRDSISVTLDETEVATREFQWETGPGDAGRYTAEVIPENGEGRSRSVVIEESGSFAVDIVSTNSPVVEGDTLAVTATVENTGAEPDTQEVDLLIGDLLVDSTTLTLEPGASETVTLEWGTESGVAGDYEATVTSADDADSTGVTVEEDAGGFVVNVEGTNSPVVEGETLAVTATVANTGDEADTQTVDLRVGGSTVATASVSLDAGASETVTLEWGTEIGDAGGYTAIVSSADDTGTAEVIVVEQGEFAVDIASTNSPVVEGDPLEVTATVENTGDETGTQAVELVVDGQVFDSVTVTLEPGDSETVTLTWETAGRLTGTYTATVRTEDGASDAAEVEVLEPAAVAVDIASTNSPVVEGDPLSVTATVTNTGEATATQTVDLTIDGSTVDSTTVTLEPGASETVTLSWATIEGDAGEYTAAVASESDEATTAVTVQEPAAFAVDIASTNSPVVEGVGLAVTATVENTGDATDTQTISLAVDDERRGSTSLTLSGGESETVTLTWATGDGDAGEYTAVVASEDDEDATGVRVETPSGTDGSGDGPRFEVEIESTTAPVVEGRPVAVTALVTNVGGETDTQPITLTSGGAERDSQELTLDGGESETITLSWGTLHGDAGEYTAAVASEADEATTPVEVTGADGAPTFAVTIEEVSPPDGPSGTFAVTATIENVDDRADTQTITLTSGGAERDSQELTLSGGGSETIALSWEAEGVDADTVDVEVASESDSDTSAASLGDDGGGVSATTWLLLLLLLLLLFAVYYYVRRRRMESRGPDVEDA